MEKTLETVTTNILYKENITKETTHCFSAHVVKKDNNSDHFLESGVVNFCLLKNDRKYESNKKEGKKRKIYWYRNQGCWWRGEYYFIEIGNKWNIIRLKGKK